MKTKIDEMGDTRGDRNIFKEFLFLLFWLLASCGYYSRAAFISLLQSFQLCSCYSRELTTIEGGVYLSG